MAGQGIPPTGRRGLYDQLGTRPESSPRLGTVLPFSFKGDRSWRNSAVPIFTQCGRPCGVSRMRTIWRRGESNPRPKSLAARSLHAYPAPVRSSVGRPLARRPVENALHRAALRAGQTRCRLARSFSPLPHGPSGSSQPAVRRLISSPRARPEETGYLWIKQPEPTVGWQLCWSTRSRAGGARHAFWRRQLPSKPCRPQCSSQVSIPLRCRQCGLRR